MPSLPQLSGVRGDLGGLHAQRVIEYSGLTHVSLSFSAHMGHGPSGAASRATPSGAARRAARR